MAWEKIYQANPFLQAPGRRFVDSDGRTIVRVHPGEKLAGLDALGIVPTQVSPAVTSPAPVTQPTQPPIVVTKAPLWPWWLITLLVLVLLLVWLFSRNPTRWRPVVAGGVNDDATARELLASRAAQRGASLIQGSQSRVRLYGVWNTQHRGVPVPVPHRYDAERAWRARFRMPNGTERMGYMIQGCGNDVTIAGRWYTPLAGARVEEGWGDETPAPAPIVEPAAPPAPVVEPAPEPAPAPVVEHAPSEDGVVKLELRKATFDQPAMVRMTGIDETADTTCEIRSGSVILRFRPKN